MSATKRHAQKHAKARQRRFLKAQERLDRDRRQEKGWQAVGSCGHVVEWAGTPGTFWY